jgi:hypothetical protein
MFRSPEIIHIAEGELRVGVAVALADDFPIHKQAIRQVKVGERTVVLVLEGLVVFKPDGLSRKQLIQKGACLLAKKLNRLSRIDGLGSVNADESDGPDAGDHDGVTVNDPINAVEGLRPDDGAERHKDGKRTRRT